MPDRPPPSPSPWVIAAAAMAAWLALGTSRHRALLPPPRQRDRGQKPHAATIPQDGAGRDADHPHQIPRAGWWMIIKRTLNQANEDRLLSEAAGVTFYALLALFPAIAALISLYGLIADPATISKQFDQLQGIVPGGGMQLIEEQVRRVSSKPSGTLGVGAIIGLAVSLWSANQATKAMFDALNVVYEEKEKRSFIRLTLVSLAFTLGGLIFAIVSMIAVILLPVVFNVIGLQTQVEWLLRIARWPLLLLLVGTILAALYRFGPSRERARWRWVTWGSAMAAIVWFAGSIGFSWYVENFGSYNETYGSLGAVIGFMTWIWISSAVVLLGGELNAEMEHQTARDTTTGPEQPMGTRGAKMADTVAP
ncbi:YihY/virulence factor BrkB family protein [Falsiroseomonas sp. HW251]|uniref:YihY/virulence factor BrkB family protein n=1 Tax=Falsiroseomonas sp. HW251 TaxID=3390998 RepID=UPI003D30FCB4